MRRARILVSGKVQGVFFRQMLRVVATRNSVTGWARNLGDGRVEAVLEGGDGDVEAVVRWSREGPANSRVSGVEVAEEDHAGEFRGFEVRY